MPRCATPPRLTTMTTASFAERHAPPRAKEDYTEAQKLRAEVESPFSQARLFAFPALFAAAGIASYFAGTALLASSLGVRDPNPNGVGDLAIDLGSMVALGFLWRRELQGRESRLKRISFGSKLAALRVAQLAASDGRLKSGPAVSLADLRRGRGQARRVVILCAPEETLVSSLEVACASASDLAAADFLIVPLISTGTATSPTLIPLSLDRLQTIAQCAPALAQLQASAAMVAPAAEASSETQPPLPWEAAKPDAALGWPVALPLSGGWASALSSELEQASKQDASIMGRGLTVILKKNGRVGTRRLGMPNWSNLLMDVEGRRRAGLDVVNI